VLKVLVVDDSEMSRDVIVKFLKFKGYEVFEASNGNEALYIMGKEEDIDVVLLDVEMPVMNGIETVRNIRISGYPAIVIMLTGLGDEETMKKAAQNGADDFLTKPVDLVLLLSKLVAIEKYKKFHEEKTKTFHESTRKIGDLMKSAMKLSEENKHLSIELVHLIYIIAEYRDDETHAHTMRVGWLSGEIAAEMGLSEEEAAMIQLAAPLHDVGKIGVPDLILLKPDRLTDEEFEKMKKHTLIGYDILRNSSSGVLKKAAVISLTHHERWNGSGYPKGLKGEDIPIEGLIVAVADSFDAMVCKRVYKGPIPMEKAFEEIKNLSGVLYSPKVIDAFIQIKDKVFKYYEVYKSA